MVKLSELRAGQGKVDIEVTVKSKADVRSFQKYGRELKVANAIVEDESGEIQMSLWNADADAVNVGDKLKITNGYVSEFNGIKQLTSGKYGKLEVVGKEKDPAHHTPLANAPSKESKKSSKKTDKKTKEEGLEADEDDVDEEDLDYEEKEF